MMEKINATKANYFSKINKIDKPSKNDKDKKKKNHQYQKQTMGYH